MELLRESNKGLGLYGNNDNIMMIGYWTDNQNYKLEPFVRLCATVKASSPLCHASLLLITFPERSDLFLTY